MGAPRRLHLALGLTGAQSLELAVARRLDPRPLRTISFTAIGVDRLRGPVGVAAPDPFVLVAHLRRRIPDAALVGVAAPVTDHPYNLARKVLSADHLTRGLGGVVVTGDDHYASEVGRGDDAEEAVEDALRALPRVWQTWRPDAVVADVGRRIFADTSRIRRADHHGRSTIDGPGTLPASPQGTPVLIRHLAHGEAPGTAPVDILLTPDRAWSPDGPARLDGAPGSADRFILTSVDGITATAGRLADRIGGLVDEPDAAGILVTLPDLPGAEVPAVVSSLPARLAGAFAVGTGDTLRGRLGLGVPPDLLVGAPPAFGPAGGERGPS